MNAIDKLTEQFKKFPGIGPRQARRFVYYLLRQNKEDVNRFADSILDLKENIRVCEDSFCHFYSNDKDEKLSPIAKDPGRNDSILMIVGTDTDLESVERQGVYNGRYFVLGGLVGALESKPEEKIRSRELSDKVQEKARNGLKEIIIALSANPDGENTHDYLLGILSPIQNKYSITVSTLGRGISTGTELEYIDEGTMRSALENRR